ncbi:response regulator [Aquimarina spongiae]|uniref:histidine kinase n=1 Tax=Aquimarina spongiae TaxID=570521 RepID=A0A1M6AX41_9FLAO|nr:response regulator [Aquimarina spongiae]SHI40783.1 Histidine kinase-, DNA gyrase B-, and HSP90-like ATPase [Aquimarina spongiae]
MTYYVIGGILLVVIAYLLVQCIKVKRTLGNKNKELLQLQEQTQKQYEAQQSYISLLSQELRVPLYGIMGLTHLIEEENPKLKDNKKIKSLKFSSNYLLMLINNVLHINYMDAEEIELQNTIFDVKEITQNLIHSFSYATENSDNKLEYHFDPEIQNQVVGDPTVLTQILMNLLSNALRFTENGSVHFSVDLIKNQENTYTISFKVHHNGFEISKEDQKSIYKEFMNIDQAKTSYLGTGLNSRIVNKLANLLNGEVIKENNAKIGSEYAFVVNLPIHQTEKTAEQPATSSMASKDEETSTIPEQVRALVVDDNKLNLLVADKMLSKENFNCTTIDNGFDAIELAKNNTYDVILMDINMPKLNGIGTTKRIREFDPKTPIIALTAVDVTQLNRQILHAGLNDYILKPYSKGQLLEIIDKHLKDTSPS